MKSAEKPRICFINTPGEITQAVEGFVSPLEVSPTLNRVAQIDVIDLTEPRLEIAQLSLRVADIIHSNLEDYDGFVVTARKDYLQHIAPRLAFAFGPSLDKTVVATATDTLAAFDYSSASIELIRAAMVASQPFKEVVISFEDLITRGVDSKPSPNDNLTSYTYTPYSNPGGHLGVFTRTGIKVNHQRDFKAGEDTFYNHFENAVPYILVGSGSDPNVWGGLVESGIQGVVLESPGWKIPTLGYYSFVHLAGELTGKKIPVMLTSRSNDTLVDENEKLQGGLFDSLNCIYGRFMTPEVAAAKFSWVIAGVNGEIAAGILPKEEKLPKIKELMRRPYVGEYGIYKPFTTPPK